MRTFGSRFSYACNFYFHLHDMISHLHAWKNGSAHGFATAGIVIDPRRWRSIFAVLRCWRKHGYGRGTPGTSKDAGLLSTLRQVKPYGLTYYPDPSQYPILLLEVRNLEGLPFWDSERREKHWVNLERAHMIDLCQLFDFRDRFSPFWSLCWPCTRFERRKQTYITCS